MATGVKLAVGDHVRLLTRGDNEHKSYQTSDSLVAPEREPVDGLVLSIRDITSGQLVSEVTGDIQAYIIELLNDRTFSTKFASLINAPRGIEKPTATPRWQRVQAVLREATEGGILFSTAMDNLFTESPLARFLDGWKVVKIRSSEVESLEQPEVAPKPTE